MSHEKPYRVWIEKIERGWVTVNARDEEQARDRAQDVVAMDRWYPEDSHAHACGVELVQSVQE